MTIATDKPTGSIRTTRLLVLAVAVTTPLCVLAVAHALGLRESTSILSGTAPPGGSASTRSVLGGVVYLLSYFAALIVSPILLLSAAIVSGGQWLASRFRGPRQSTTP